MSSTGTPDISRLRIDTPPQSEQRSYAKRFAVAFGILAAVIAGTFVWWFAGPKAAEQKAMVPDEAIPASARPGPAPAAGRPAGGLDATGYVVAQRKAAVSSKATGRLKELRVVEGDRLQQGEIIGVLENDDAQALVAQEEASLAAALARGQFAAAELKEASVGWKRAQALSGERVIARTEVDAALARFGKAEADVELARANVELARARLEKIKVDLEYTLIRSPFSGTVLTKDAEVGEIVAPFGSSANARAAVVTIADMDSLQVEADVSEANLAKVFVGQKCSITLDSYPDKKYEGQVGSIVPTVDRAKATVRVKIRFLEKRLDGDPGNERTIRFVLKDQ